MTVALIDVVTKHFAARHRSRRRFIRDVGLSAAALTTTGFASASTQDATPAAVDAADDAGETREFLFVQSFGHGALTPHAETDGIYTLSLDLGLDQTIYFSDRPERIVGAISTTRFLEMLGFTPANPPNAALVVDSGTEGTQVVVVELLNPRQDSVTRTLAYDVRLLADDDRLNMTLLQQRIDSDALPDRFGPAHLFIDDCPDAKIQCWTLEGNGGPPEPHTYLGDLPPGTAPNGLWPYCFDPFQGCCRPCRWSSAGLQSFCQEEYPDGCGGHLCAAVSPNDVAGECGVL